MFHIDRGDTYHHDNYGKVTVTDGVQLWSRMDVEMVDGEPVLCGGQSPAVAVEFEIADTGRARQESLKKFVRKTVGVAAVDRA